MGSWAEFLLCGQRTTYSRVVWGPIYNADSWALFQALNRSQGKRGAITCILGYCGHMDVKTAQRAGQSFTQRPWIVLQNVDSQNKTEQKAPIEFQRGKPLEIDFHKYLL